VIASIQFGQPSTTFMGVDFYPDGRYQRRGEAYRVANIRNDIDGLRSLSFLFTVADPEFVLRNIADGHGSFNSRMTVYDWSGF
jgi:hypothetical protein